MESNIYNFKNGNNCPEFMKLIIVVVKYCEIQIQRRVQVITEQ